MSSLSYNRKQIGKTNLVIGKEVSSKCMRSMTEYRMYWFY